MGNADKQNKKDMMKKWKAEQRTAAQAKFPLPIAQMKAMFDMLDNELPAQGCDHTTRLTSAWLTKQNLPVEQVLAWLQDNGGGCDCEALANAEETFNEAVGE